MAEITLAAAYHAIIAFIHKRWFRFRGLFLWRPFFIRLPHQGNG